MLEQAPHCVYAVACSPGVWGDRGTIPLPGNPRPKKRTLPLHGGQTSDCRQPQVVLSHAVVLV